MLGRGEKGKEQGTVVVAVVVVVGLSLSHAGLHAHVTERMQPPKHTYLQFTRLTRVCIPELARMDNLREGGEQGDCLSHVK